MTFAQTMFVFGLYRGRVHTSTPEVEEASGPLTPAIVVCDLYRDRVCSIHTRGAGGERPPTSRYVNTPGASFSPSSGTATGKTLTKADE